jgi:hypothetical protein
MGSVPNFHKPFAQFDRFPVCLLPRQRGGRDLDHEIQFPVDPVSSLPAELQLPQDLIENLPVGIGQVNIGGEIDFPGVVGERTAADQNRRRLSSPPQQTGDDCQQKELSAQRRLRLFDLGQQVPDVGFEY